VLPGSLGVRIRGEVTPWRRHLYHWNQRENPRGGVFGPVAHPVAAIAAGVCPITPMPRILSRDLYGREHFVTLWHRNNLSEKSIPTPGGCVHTTEQTSPAGYMRGVASVEEHKQLGGPTGCTFRPFQA
jgi:hypothetical protein